MSPRSIWIAIAIQVAGGTPALLSLPARCRTFRAPPMIGPRSTGGAMRHDLMDILACPLCKGALTLSATREEGDEVLQGALHCAACNETYPIVDGIPNLLPPDLRRAMEAEPSAGGVQPGSLH
jgi:uncharacterized protein